MSIVSIMPTWASLPGVGEARVYLLDLQALRPQQHEVLVKALAERFGLTIEEAWAEWERGGVPILTDDVEVMTTDLASVGI